MTLKALRNVTFSPASASGHMLCVWPDGRITDPCGQAVARASLSVQQAQALGLLTSATSGQLSTISSRSADLTLSLASKFRQSTAALGSTMYKLTWKEWVLPSGRSISALRASVPRTSGKDCSLLATGWPTPSTRDGKGGYQGGRIRNGKLSTDTLDVTAQISGWPTPVVNDSKGSDYSYSRGDKNKISLKLGGAAKLTDSGTMLTGATVEMKNGGQLNPAHSRWLMGLPTVWDDCGAMVTRSMRKSPKRS